MAERSKALRSGRSPLLWAWVRIPLLTWLSHFSSPHYVLLATAAFCHCFVCILLTNNQPIKQPTNQQQTTPSYSYSYSSSSSSTLALNHYEINCIPTRAHTYTLKHTFFDESNCEANEAGYLVISELVACLGVSVWDKGSGELNA